MPTDEPPTDLTALMSLDPLDLTKQDLDRIISYQRKQRAMREGGAKTKKESVAPVVDIKVLLSKVQTVKVASDAPATKPTVSSGGGFVRRF